MGLFDDLLEVGICFDWLSPMAAIIGHLGHGGGHTFSIVDGGYTGHEVERMLRKEGITTWGLFHPAFSDCVLISVPKDQAVEAQRILDANGVGTNSAPPKGYELPSQPRGKKSDRRTMNEIATSVARMQARSKGEPYQPGRGWLW